MLDLVFVLGGVFFFAISIAYVYGCAWIIKEDKAADTAYLETSGEKTGHQTA